MVVGTLHAWFVNHRTWWLFEIIMAYVWNEVEPTNQLRAGDQCHSLDNQHHFIRHKSDDEIIQCDLAILLPHKLFVVFLEYNDAAWCQAKRRKLIAARADLVREGAVPEDIWFGSWQGGVPFNNNRDHSLEMWSLLMPAVPQLRVPILAQRSPGQTTVARGPI